MRNTIHDTSSVMAALESALVKTLLPGEAQGQYLKGDIAKRHLLAFAETIKKMSGAYVERDSGKEIMPFGDKEAKAYALYYSPLNFIKVFNLLSELPANFHERPLRAFDFGSGPGTASLAMAAFFPEVHIDAFDHSAAMLSVARKVFPEFVKEAGGRAASSLEVTSSLPANGKEYDIIVAANVINEIPPEDQEEMLGKLVSLLSSDGVLFLLDPALQQSTRRLMWLRDRLLQIHRELVPTFPCTWCDNCPMLSDSDTDWCHSTIHEGSGWQRSKLVKTFDEITGFNKHKIKYAAFIFQKGGELKSGYRVILPPEKEKRGHSALVCGSQKYGRMLLPKSARSESNARFSKLKVFDLVQITDVGEEMVICPDSRVLNGPR